MCRFWLLGQCRKGIACPFSHDNAHPDSFLCPYFQQGTCKHGARCKYDHRVPEALDGRLDARPDGWSSTGVTASPCEGVGRAASERHGSLSAVVQPSAQRAPPARAPAGSALLHETRQVIADEAPICVYYAQRGGRCQFGDQCRFRHPDAAVGDASTHRSPSRGLSIKAPAPQRATVEAATGALQSLQLTGRGRAAAGSHALAIRPPPGSAWLQPGESAASVAAAQCSEAGAEATGVRAPAGLSLFDDNEELADPWSMADKPRAPKADAGAGVADEDAPVEAEPQAEAAAEMLCPAFTMTGACVAGGECPYLHGGCCPICQLNCLHPYDEGISEAHVADCAAAAKLMHDRATSAVKECAICMETVLTKEAPAERRFGLMNCDHCFCLSCIRSWREKASADSETTRACPLCRTRTHFITPSNAWPSNAEHKAQIIQGYQSALATRHCRHFDFGRGECPFGTSCFYRHEFEDGSLQDRTPDFRKAVDANGEHAVIHPINLSSFMEMQASLHNHYSWQ